MQLKKLIKSTAIALPMIALAACSSSDKADEMSADTMTNEEVMVSEQVVYTSSTSSPNTMSEQEVLLDELRENQTVYFAFNSNELAPEYESMLDAHASFLRSNPNIAVAIEGHADERGTPEYNIALGERRAVVVANYLKALGVPSAQISVVSFGEEKPLMLGQSAEAYQQNRRAVLVY